MYRVVIVTVTVTVKVTETTACGPERGSLWPGMRVGATALIPFARAPDYGKQCTSHTMHRLHRTATVLFYAFYAMLCADQIYYTIMKAGIRKLQDQYVLRACT